MKLLMLCLLMTPFPAQEAGQGARNREVSRLVDEIVESGQVLQIAIPAEERVEPAPRIAPGDPPLLAFRYLEGQSKHRFGQLDLVMDDAGH